MIDTYSDYIEHYVTARPPMRLQGRPGEHHFVATYLLPRVWRITGRTPYYVNPDGMKGVAGDILYYSADRLCLSIEVKFDVVRLTKNEFNAGICDEEGTGWPGVFVGVCAEGLLLLEWAQFRRRYVDHCFGGRTPERIKQGYGPQPGVARLMREGAGCSFPVRAAREEAAAGERAFVAALSHAIGDVSRWPDVSATSRQMG